MNTTAVKFGLTGKECVVDAGCYRLRRPCLRSDATSSEFVRYRPSTFAVVRGLAASGRAVDAVRPLRPRHAPHGSFRRVRFHTLLAKVRSEVAPSFAQRRLANVQPRSLLADCLDDPMHVRLGLARRTQQRNPRYVRQTTPPNSSYDGLIPIRSPGNDVYRKFPQYREASITAREFAPNDDFTALQVSCPYRNVVR